MKDLFSQQAAIYAKFRPSYPEELFQYLVSFVNDRKKAWDCATGNGQAAQALSAYFDQVEATDISQQQLDNALSKPNIRYQLSAAEHTPFENDSFDLITVATAYHWLNWKTFKEEATRVGKPGCVVAVWAYQLLISDRDDVNELVRHFYKDVVGDYWDPERRYIDESYETVAFDFDPLPAREFFIEKKLSADDFLGYLNSWSAVKNYMDRNGSSPVALIEEEARRLWAGQELDFRFPIFMRIGRITK